MSSSSSKRSVSFATTNNWKKELTWLIVELENNLPSGLFCKVCLKYEDKLKGLRGYNGKCFPQGTEAVVQRCSVKEVLEIS